MIDHSITHPFEPKANNDVECQQCDQHLSAHPDKMQYLAKRTMERIIRVGHEVRYIYDDQHAFAYSVGRTAKERPELLITGALPPQTLQYVVNRVAELDEETPITPGQDLYEVLDGFPVRLVQVRNLEEAEMYGVTENFGTLDPTAIQILWPDSEGRFPGEPGFGYPSEAQPVFA